jgi:hypothetical protein
MDDHLWLCPKSTAFQVFSEGLVNYGPLPWSQGFHLPPLSQTDQSGILHAFP